MIKRIELLVLAVLALAPLAALPRAFADVTTLYELQPGNANGGCGSIGGVWHASSNTCALGTTFRGYGESIHVDSGVTLRVNAGITMEIDTVIGLCCAANQYTFDGYLNVSGSVVNYGTILIGCPGDMCYGGQVYNHGIIKNEPGSSFITAFYYPQIYNYGKINDFCNVTFTNGGTLTGNPVHNLCR